MGRILNNWQTINKMSILLLLLAGLLAYGANTFVIKLLKVPREKAFKIIILFKVLGIIVGIFGLYIINK